MVTWWQYLIICVLIGIGAGWLVEQISTQWSLPVYFFSLGGMLLLATHIRFK